MTKFKAFATRTDAIARQLTEGRRHPIGWIGEGSPAKAYVGVLTHAVWGRRGLRLTIRRCDTGRPVCVVWRVSRAVAEAALERDGMDTNTIIVCRIDGQWHARHEGPHRETVVGLFGTDTLPLPFTALASVGVVVNDLVRRNPGMRIEIDPDAA